MGRVRAIIIEGDRLLVFKRTKGEKVYWVLPGGGVEEGETDGMALKREIKEELGVIVEVGEKVFSQILERPETLGQIENFYLCQIVGGELGTGHGPEFAGVFPEKRE